MQDDITSEVIYNKYESSFNAVHAGIKLAKELSKDEDDDTNVAYRAYLLLKEDHDKSD